MMRYVRLLMLLLLALCCANCGGLGQSHKLASVQYEYTYAFERFDRTVTITPDGMMEVNQVKGINGEVKRVKVTLDKEEMDSIAATFQGWRELKPYYSVIFGPTIVIVYDGYQVQSSGGDDTPQKFTDAQNLLDIYAQAALNVVYPNGDLTIDPTAPPATQAATQLSTEPATMPATMPATGAALQP